MKVPTLVMEPSRPRRLLTDDKPRKGTVYAESIWGLEALGMGSLSTVHKALFLHTGYQ